MKKSLFLILFLLFLLSNFAINVEATDRRAPRSLNQDIDETDRRAPRLILSLDDVFMR